MITPIYLITDGTSPKYYLSVFSENEFYFSFETSNLYIGMAKYMYRNMKMPYYGSVN